VTRGTAIVCPYCMRQRVLGRGIEAAYETGGADGPLPELGPRPARVYWCRGADGCGAKIPAAYVDGYAEYPPIFCPLGGLPGHGKTVYLFSLLSELARNAARGTGAASLPVGDGIQDVIEWTRMWREEGRLPQGTAFAPTHSCIILRITGQPVMPRFHLVLQDASGEVVEDEVTIRHNGRYLTDAPLAMLFVSLDDLATEGRTFNESVLARYVEATRSLGRPRRTQSLLVVLTKADRLVGEDGLPQEARSLLLGDPDERSDAGVVADRARREALSWALERWLATQIRFGQAVRNAREEFAEVRYCAVSATGGPPRTAQGDWYLAAGASPRGVLDPLSWLVDLHADRPLRLRLTAEVEACRRGAPAYELNELDTVEQLLSEGRYRLAEQHLRRAHGSRPGRFGRGLVAVLAALTVVCLVALGWAWGHFIP
jgi:hypothetical protein